MVNQILVPSAPVVAKHYKSWGKQRGSKSKFSPGPNPRKWVIFLRATAEHKSFVVLAKETQVERQEAEEKDEMKEHGYDVDADEVSIGDKVTMTFRRLFTSDGIHDYFWKGRPVRTATSTKEA